MQWHDIYEVESNEKQNLENLSRNIMEFETGVQAVTAFISFQAVLEYVFKLDSVVPVCQE